MDKGTPYNILTELKMTSDQYNLVTTMYYVSELGLSVNSEVVLIPWRSLTSLQKPRPTFC